MSDLVNFLTARLAEDEQWARDEQRRAVEVHGPTVLLNAHEHLAGLSSSLNVASRVLAEVAAKRAILALHSPDADGFCPLCIREEAGWGNDWVVQAEQAPCPTLRLLASVYADHPSYLPEWKSDSAAEDC